MARSRLDLRIDPQASGSRARAATFPTLHGPVEDTVFVPVAGAELWAWRAQEWPVTLLWFEKPTA